METNILKSPQISSEQIEKSLSPLRMKNLHFSNIEMSFDGANIEKLKTNISVSHDMIHQNQDKITVKIDLHSETGGFRLAISAQAIFSVESEEDISQNVLIQRNAVSIMFPFIRSEITLITSQPGMVPVLMPALNINKLLDDLKSTQDPPCNN